MIQSEVIKTLMESYKKAEIDYNINQNISFYRYLKNKLVSTETGSECDKKEILEGYKIACRSYLDSNFLETNISIAALLLSIAGLLQIIDLKIPCDKEICIGNIVGSVIIIAVVSIAYLGITMHNKRRKLLEILMVLEGLLESTDALDQSEQQTSEME